MGGVFAVKKYLFLLVVSLLVFSGMNVKVSADGFSDLTEGQRLYKEMVFLEERGIIAGYPDGTFRPDGEVTRAAAAIMIGRALGLDGKQRATKFSDVGTLQEASGYIASAVERGIIQGFPDGKYRPDETVTRGQMAIFLSRAFKLKEEIDIPFSDVSPSIVSYSDIRKVLAGNIAQGYDDYTFRPNQNVTRAQFSAFLARALNDEFKVVTISYKKDIHRTYYYDSADYGTLTYIYEGVKNERWNAWKVYAEGKYAETIVESENIEGYFVGWPDSEYETRLQYPLTVGKKWEILYEGDPIHEITAVNKTVTTPAGTFHHVVEITTENGWTHYYAPKVGLIKSYNNGSLSQELIKIENK
jgi:hypothetical protein